MKDCYLLERKRIINADTRKVNRFLLLAFIFTIAFLCLAQYRVERVSEIEMLRQEKISLESKVNNLEERLNESGDYIIKLSGQLPSRPSGVHNQQRFK